MRRVVWAGIVLIAVVSVGWVTGNLPLSPTTEVAVVYPSRGDLDVGFVAAGRVQGRIVRIAPATSGRIRSILVKQNDRVHRNQVLALLDDDDIRNRIRSLQAELEVAESREREARALIDLRNSIRTASEQRASAARQQASWKLREAVSGPTQAEISHFRAAVRRALARLELARREQARMRKLFADDIVSASQVEQADTDVKTAEADYAQAAADLRKAQEGTRKESIEVARAEVTRARAESDGVARIEVSLQEERVRAASAEVARIRAFLRAEESRLDRMSVRAPSKGVIAQIPYEPGEVVDWNQPLMTLVADDAFSVEANVDEQDSGYVALHQVVDVSCTALPGVDLKGTVVRVAPSLETRPNLGGDSRTLRIKVSLPSADPRLRHGLDADVRGRVVLAQNVVIVPRSMVARDGRGDYVLSIVGGRTARIPVRIGAVTADRVEVKEGLQTDIPMLSPDAAPGPGVPVRARP